MGTGGLVFTTCTAPYLKAEYGDEWEYDAPVRLLDRYLHSLAKSHDEQCVILGHVLASEVTVGYEDIGNTEVLAFNGIPIRNLKQLADLVDACEDKYMRFELADRNVVVSESATAREETVHVLEHHGIPQARSKDLLGGGDVAK